MSPVLRDAVEGDLPAITALYGAEVEGGTATFETTPPGLEEMTRRFTAVQGHALPWLVAETDGRFAGGTSGLSIGHASPEAAAGGAIGLVREGDKILINIHERSINLLISDEELAKRRTEQDAKGWKPVEKRPRKVTTALKAYALLATSADKGAVRDKALLDRLVD